MSDSPVPPSGDDDEVTGIHDVPHGMRAWAESISRRVRRTESKLDRFLTKHETERGILKSIPTWLAVGALLLTWAGGLVALYVHAQQPPPQQPSAEQIAEKLIKLQAKPQK